MMDSSFLRLWNTTFPSRLAIAVVCLVLLACGGAETSPDETGGGMEAPPANKTITIVSSIDMRDVNELTAESTPIHTALHYYALFLPLLEEQPDFADGPPSFEPRLAKSWQFSDDRKTLTFHLRPNVVWSDGMPVTAEDVRFTWEAQTHPDIRWNIAEIKRHITDVEVVDEHTVRFHYDAIYANQLLDAIGGVILPKHAWGELPFAEWRESAEWFRENLVVSGPFTLTSWEPQQRFVLERNPRFFRLDRPRVDRIVFRVVPERTSALALLRSGEAHLIDWARPGDAAELEDHPEIRIETFTIRGFNALIWNTSRPLFKSPKVRRALTMAIDRERIVEALYYGYAKVGFSPFPANLWVQHPDLEPWPYDPETARQLLAEEGWRDTDGDGLLDKADGESRRTFSFEILTPAGNELRQDILTMVQQQLEAIGVEAKQRVLEFNTQLTREREHDFDASFDAWGLPTNLDLSTFYHTDAAEDRFNFGVYSNPDADRILDEIGNHIDPQEALPLFYELQELLHEEQPVTFLYEPVRIVPMRRSLVHADPNLLSTFFDLEEWELEEPPASP